MLVIARFFFVFILLPSYVVLIKEVNLTISIPTGSCTHLYEKGVEAYLENRFNDCVIYIENAIENYRNYMRNLTNCRLKCRDDVDLSEPLYPTNIDNLLFYENTIKITLCIIKCKKKFKKLFGEYNINNEVQKLFDNNKPYEYLHICYFQIKEHQKAASAAFTYLITNPDDKIMFSNLKYYYDMEDVDKLKIINFEAKDYVYFYVHGADAYDKKDWDDVIKNMEKSLKSYLQSDDMCRAQCEGAFDQGWYPDFIPSIANHFTFCLRCKQNCKNKLNSLNGEKHDDLLPSHYHYLQYAYFKKGQMKKACSAVASYLLFYPNDETMMNNMVYYQSFPNIENELFTPRPEAIKYIQRQFYEKKIMKFISEQFTFDTEKEAIPTLEPVLKFRITLTEKQLSGRNRFVSEGLASRKDCRILLEMAKIFALPGDGYYGKQSPHTNNEKFVGITLDRASLLVYFNLLNPDTLKLLLKVSENAKNKIQEYFHLDHLYFTYTHLVCRSALSNSSKSRTDFSHAIHADNCNILKNGTCTKIPPAFTWRDFSAIIYLNNNFEGGEFIFSNNPYGDLIQYTIKPNCGRMVAFSSGVENLHGVKGVKKGSRCALGLWFTLDQNHEETERKLAYKLLK